MALVEELKSNFQKLANEDRLFHAYMFFGSSARSIELAAWLAQYLENSISSATSPTGKCTTFAKSFGYQKKANFNNSSVSEPIQNTSPLLVDARFVKTGGISEIREGISYLWQKPFCSPKKTLIIENGEKMTREAQNAILKIAEEPPPHALLILVVSNPDILLPALCSRFHKIYIHEIVKNSGLETKIQRNVQLKKFLNANIKQRKDMLKEIVEDSQKMEEFVASLISYFKMDLQKNWRTIKELSRRWALISQYNVNKRLQLEAALLDIIPG